MIYSLDKIESEKVVFIDLETSLFDFVGFSIGNKVSINHDQIVKESQIISASWSHLGGKYIYQLDWGLKEQNDFNLLKDLRQVIVDAEVVIGHNHKSFDMKYIQRRLAYHGLSPIPVSPNILYIDTMNMSSQLGLASKSLAYAAKYLKIGEKLKTDFQLWKDVRVKNKKAFDYMLKYNFVDVLLQELVFLKMAPYCKLPTHLTSVLLGCSHKDCCPRCGSSSRDSKGRCTQASGIQYRRYSCRNCGHVYKGRHRLNELSETAL